MPLSMASPNDSTGIAAYSSRVEMSGKSATSFLNASVSQSFPVPSTLGPVDSLSAGDKNRYLRMKLMLIDSKFSSW